MKVLGWIGQWLIFCVFKMSIRLQALAFKDAYMSLHEKKENYLKTLIPDFHILAVCA